MTAPVYSKLLMGVFTSLPSEQFTNKPPPGFIWIVRDIDVYLGAGGSPTAMDVQVNDHSGDPYFVPITLNNPTAPFHAQWRGRQVIPSDATLIANFVGGPWSLSISGYELSLP